MPQWGPWKVVVATIDEIQPSKQERTWPCTDAKNSNRYLGCVGVRKCKALGTQMCIFGRWPTSSRTSRFLLD